MNSNSTENRDIRKFGVIALLFLGSLCALGIYTGRGIAIYLFGSLAIVGLGFIVIPEPLRPVYMGWLKMAHFIGTVVTAIMLTLAYYLVITPSGILKRILGGAPLPSKPNKTAASYWVKRDEKVQPKERFLKRY